MPKIVIKEIDKSGELAPEYLDHVVLVPGMTTESEPKLYVKIDDFVKDFADEDRELVLSKNANFAYKCLELGLPVLYAPVAAEDAVTVKGCFKQFEDKGLYDIRFITSGYTALDVLLAEDAKALIEEMIRVAAVRGDAVALCDIMDSKNKAADIKSFIDSLEVKDEDKESLLKYGALFAPKFSCKEGEFPATLGYLGAYSKSIKKFPEWYAVAGSQRGVMPFTNVKPAVEFGDADVDKLQPRGAKGEKSCNLICKVRPFGYIIWGNRTALELDKNIVVEEVEGELKASNFLNIRQLCCILKKNLYRACRKYTFEPNSDVLWSNFSNEIIEVLENMKSGNGIRGYKISREAVAKKALLRAKIRIIPIEAVEDFELTVELSDSIEVVE